MNFYKRILVPVDGSSHAILACSHAVSLAKAENSEIILLHCYGDLPVRIGGAAREEVIATSEAESMEHLAPCIKICQQSGVPFRTIVHNGSPGRMIVHIAKEEQCDLIAMGSRGLGAFSGVVLGSVSMRILETSSIPVLVIKGPSE